MLVRLVTEHLLCAGHDAGRRWAAESLPTGEGGMDIANK